MGRGVDFEGSNTVYKAPEGREDVSDLHVFANGNCIVSCWELDDAEIEAIIRTRRVFLSSFSGRVLYPTYVGAEREVKSVVADYGPIWKSGAQS